jgi:hypothetical protein
MKSFNLDVAVVEKCISKPLLEVLTLKKKIANQFFHIFVCKNMAFLEIIFT